MPSLLDGDLGKVSKEVKERVGDLRSAGFGLDAYPRWSQDDVVTDLRNIKRGDHPKGNGASLAALRANTSAAEDADGTSLGALPAADTLQLAGRITGIRLSGKFLAFIDVEYNGETLQVMLSHGGLPDVTKESFQNLTRLLRRGDHVTVRGHKSTTKRGDPALKAVELPILQAPCLQRLPVPQPLSERDPDRESVTGRYVEMLTYPHLVQTLKVRSLLIKSMRRTFEEDGFIEVQTPILGAEAGGASARPFLTTATEFTDRKLALRIAPELWLKRLMVGGLTEVFEIGPSFRNEGLDKTHNAEFTTCEFYAAHLNIERLILYTEHILHNIADAIISQASRDAYDNTILQEWLQRDPTPFARLDFVPSINAALGSPLPNLAEDSAHSDVLDIFRAKDIPIPEQPTLPRLLDKLCSHYLEPQCHKPTWIINTPECLSPLSKSFIHPTAPDNQPVAARAELFIRGKEVVNCYEEENNPFEQRRKFFEQQLYAQLKNGQVVDDEAMKVDEDYIRALEWGLPPTGGWGCGIDRLVMLATGQERISDVLSFGNLRAVTRGAEKVN